MKSYVLSFIESFVRLTGTTSAISSQPEPTMSRLQSPAGPCRTVSASSFAETFDIARRNLENKISHEEQEEPTTPDSILSEPSSPASLASPDAPTPASLATPLTDPVTPLTSGEEEVADNFAFAFDIDGVLVRGGRPIPEAIEAMKMLNGENEYGIRV